MKRIFVVPVFCLLILGSCKKDNPSQTSPAFSLVNLQLDNEALSYTYHNTSLTPQIVITFSDPVNTQSAQSSIILEGPNIAPLNFTFANNTVTVNPVTPLKYWTEYRLLISPQLTSISNKKFNSDVTVNIITKLDTTDKFPRISDDALLDSVQEKTLRYFWNFNEPQSGMARERNTSGNTVATGGSGFGLMAIVAGISRGLIARTDGIARFAKVVGFLETADRFHGSWSHWIDGTTGKVIPFAPEDDGADLVETAYMAQGLLTVRQYLTSSDTAGNNLINRITNLYNGIEWSWFRKCTPTCDNVLYWHWSPDYGWDIDFALSGYFEEQITYVMAAGSPTYGIPQIVYTNGFGKNGAIKTGNTYYNTVLPLGTPSPLFWVQYSYLGMNPNFTDEYTNYWTQNVNASLINYYYCVANPKHYTAYSSNCWGLTASDNPTGYDAQSPANDNGTITPTAALSSFPYTPTQSMNALKFFYYKMGDRMWGPYGFYDAFNIDAAWAATSTLAIDQGPIVVMIENYRSQLLWNLFMSAPEVQTAKTVLGFQ